MQARAENSRVPTPLALSMGEPSGIGPELALMAWLEARGGDIPPFVYIGDAGQLEALARRLSLTVPVRPVAACGDASDVFKNALPVLHVPLAGDAEPGKPAVANVPAVIAALDRAVALALSGEAAGVVTNPIHKSVMYEGGFAFPGHTEYLADRTGADLAVMMLAAEELRVVPVTVHLPLRAAIDRLDSRLIVQTATITARALAGDFAIARPRLAISGLNPHAGEGGALGSEEYDIIAPAVSELLKAGIAVQGPLPADTLFHERARAGYDAALCMVHDQALIAIKTLAFDRAVNVTLGLPIIRTSPDHGTALDLAGSGKARPTSLMAALKLAGRMAVARMRSGAAAADATP